MLLDFGDEKLVVVGVRPGIPSWRSHQNAHFALTDKIPCLQFIMGLLIAGARATGTTGAYYHVSPEIAGRVY